MTRICATLLFSAVLAAGCAARPLEIESGGSSADSGDDDSDPTATSTSSSTGDPGTTTADPTTTTSDPSTTDPDPTTVSTSGVPLDIWDPDPGPDIPYDACADKWGPGTFVKGNTPWNDNFAGNRAWLGMFGPFEPGMLRILILGTNADVGLNLEEASVNGGLPITGPALFIETDWWFGEWFQLGLLPAIMIYEGEYKEVLVELEVFDMLGNWDEWDPDDPARVRGQLFELPEPFSFDGQFDAAYCGALHEIQIGE